MSEEQNQLPGIIAPDTYRELSAPFTSPEEANKAVNAFFEELYELRKKHRLADVSIVVRINCRSESGEEAIYMSPSHIGNELEAEAMLGYALGMAQQRNEERTAKALARGRKR